MPGLWSSSAFCVISTQAALVDGGHVSISAQRNRQTSGETPWAYLFGSRAHHLVSYEDAIAVVLEDYHQVVRKRLPVAAVLVLVGINDVASYMEHLQYLEIRRLHPVLCAILLRHYGCCSFGAVTSRCCSFVTHTDAFFVWQTAFHSHARNCLAWWTKDRH